MLSWILLLCQYSTAQTTKSGIWSDNKKEVKVSFMDGNLCIKPIAGNAVRVQFQKDKIRQLPEWIYVDSLLVTPSYKVKEKKGILWITLPELEVSVNRESGKVSFFNAQHQEILVGRQHKLESGTVQGENTYCAELKLDSPEDESLFGLGQFQDGYLNVRGLSRRLTQVNTQISIPFILSDKGYGLLWNNYGLTDFNPSDQSVVFSKHEPGGDKTEVNVTSTEGGKKEMRESNVFTAKLTVPTSGKYALLLDVGQRMARSHHLTIDGKTMIDVKNIWLPPTTSIMVDLEAGTHQLTAKLEKEDHPVLYYKKVENETVFRSPVAESVDYTVFSGDADKVIATYRQVTGEVPLMPRWALGYIHCRERFHNQQELLETASKFRTEKIPMDVIVQDWQYWGKYGWNAMCFDEADYPDPKSMVERLHQMNARLMLSVWSKIDIQSKLGEQMAGKGYFIPNTSWVDFFNPQAADFYWKNFSDRLLKPYRIDAWWQDATEPENDDLQGRKIMNGTMPGEIFRNTYPLLVNKTVYEGCRRDDPTRRTMILTRSAFTGMQRYGVATWSGDVGNDWETLRRQITGGLSLMATGLPWWTYDAGGFFRPWEGQYTDSRYQERFLRWLQISTFLPLMRVHGYMTDTEFWNYGQEVTRIARTSLDLRYRLLPYIYSEAAAISLKGSTLMRPLVMDFGNDSAALSQKYQFMFGPSLLVAPIVEEKPAKWNVYLPQYKAGWYDFWTGQRMLGGQVIEYPVTLEHIPLFVKAGTILPLGTPCQYSEEAVDKSWEIRVYPGADGHYTIYEDEGSNYNYEKGNYSLIRLEWKDAANELVIYPKEGTYPGMCEKRTMKLIKVNNQNGVGVEMENATQKEIEYSGKKVKIKL